ncbi:MAG TPA: glycosyltransferase family 2 protein [Trichocoleus sp.]|jgi:glycosyltransferase involved in cell wall biosynthesis
MRISIITVCKNAEQFIEQAIESVVNQTYPDLEYVVIDGDSQDQTKEIIARYADRISTYISEPDRGLYQAMNKGIRYATGEYLCFLNADDYLIDRDVIKDVAQFLQGNPTCDFVYGNLEVRYSPEKIIVEPPPPENIIDELICGCIPHQASFARSDLFFDRVGFFNENHRISSDYEWFLKLIQNETVKLSYYPRLISSYYAGGLSSQIRLSVPESHRIQNQCPLYQEEYWLKRRILKYQEHVVNLREWLAVTESQQNALLAENRLLKTQNESLLTQNEVLKNKLEKAQQMIDRLRTNSLQPK